MAAPLVAALFAHAALGWLALGLHPRTLPMATDPPGVTLVAVAADAPATDAPGEPVGADLQEAPRIEALAWPAPAPPPSAVAPSTPPPPTPPHPPSRAAHAPSRPVAKPASATPVFASPATGMAAPTPTPTGTAGPDIVAAWQAALSAWIERNRRYPAAARLRQEEGVVLVRFELDPAGRVLRAEIRAESGSPILDRAALRLLTGATLPAPPPTLDPARRTVLVPIRYRLQ